MVLHNLAAALEAQGNLDEAEGLLRRAMDIDPRYVFAPAALAMIRLQQAEGARLQRLRNRRSGEHRRCAQARFHPRLTKVAGVVG